MKGNINAIRLIMILKQNEWSYNNCHKARVPDQFSGEQEFSVVFRSLYNKWTGQIYNFGDITNGISTDNCKNHAMIINSTLNKICAMECNDNRAVSQWKRN